MNDPRDPHGRRSLWGTLRLHGVPADADIRTRDDSWHGRSVRALPPVRSHGNRYSLTVPSDARRQLARGWLWLGLFALIGSGLFSLLLVL